jgi:hypothetical protein
MEEKVKFMSDLKDAVFMPYGALGQGFWTLKFDNGAVIMIHDDGGSLGARSWWIGRTYKVIETGFGLKAIVS